MKKLPIMGEGENYTPKPFRLFEMVPEKIKIGWSHTIVMMTTIMMIRREKKSGGEDIEYVAIVFHTSYEEWQWQ